MSTRATYQINDKTFYIHHDGYPEGGAAYLFNMIKAKHKPNARGDWAMAFIRGNYNAEVTDSHDAHGDTEYQYTVTFHGKVPYLSLRARPAWTIANRWEEAYHGTLTNFITQHQDSPLFQNLSTVGATKSEVPA